MKFTLTTPCDNCPFRSDITFHLRPGRAEEIVDSMLHQDQVFSCHKTTEFDEQAERVNLGNEIHCAGILILLAKTDHLWDSYLIRLAALTGMFDPKNLHLTAPVYGTIEAFIEGVTFGNGNPAKKKPRSTNRTRQWKERLDLTPRHYRLCKTGNGESD